MKKMLYAIVMMVFGFSFMPHATFAMDEGSNDNVIVDETSDLTREEQGYITWLEGLYNQLKKYELIDTLYGESQKTFGRHYGDLRAKLNIKNRHFFSPMENVRLANIKKEIEAFDVQIQELISNNKALMKKARFIVTHDDNKKEEKKDQAPAQEVADLKNKIKNLIKEVKGLKRGENAQVAVDGDLEYLNGILSGIEKSYPTQEEFKQAKRSVKNFETRFKRFKTLRDSVEKLRQSIKFEYSLWKDGDGNKNDALKDLHKEAKNITLVNMSIKDIKVDKSKKINDDIEELKNRFQVEIKRLNGNSNKGFSDKRLNWTRGKEQLLTKNVQSRIVKIAEDSVNDYVDEQPEQVVENNNNNDAQEQLDKKKSALLNRIATLYEDAQNIENNIVYKLILDESLETFEGRRHFEKLRDGSAFNKMQNTLEADGVNDALLDSCQRKIDEYGNKLKTFADALENHAKSGSFKDRKRKKDLAAKKKFESEQKTIAAILDAKDIVDSDDKQSLETASKLAYTEENAKIVQNAFTITQDETKVKDKAVIAPINIAGQVDISDMDSWEYFNPNIADKEQCGNDKQNITEAIKACNELATYGNDKEASLVRERLNAAIKNISAYQKNNFWFGLAHNDDLDLKERLRKELRAAKDEATQLLYRRKNNIITNRVVPVVHGLMSDNEANQIFELNSEGEEDRQDVSVNESNDVNVSTKALRFNQKKFLLEKAEDSAISSELKSKINDIKDFTFNTIEECNEVEKLYDSVYKKSSKRKSLIVENKENEQVDILDQQSSIDENDEDDSSDWTDHSDDEGYDFSISPITRNEEDKQDAGNNEFDEVGDTSKMQRDHLLSKIDESIDRSKNWQTRWDDAKKRDQKYLNDLRDQLTGDCSLETMTDISRENEAFSEKREMYNNFIEKARSFESKLNCVDKGIDISGLKKDLYGINFDSAIAIHELTPEIINPKLEELKKLEATFEQITKKSNGSPLIVVSENSELENKKKKKVTFDTEKNEVFEFNRHDASVDELDQADVLTNNDDNDLLSISDQNKHINALNEILNKFGFDQFQQFQEVRKELNSFSDDNRMSELDAYILGFKVGTLPTKIRLDQLVDANCEGAAELKRELDCLLENESYETLEELIEVEEKIKTFTEEKFNPFEDGNDVDSKIHAVIDNRDISDDHRDKVRKLENEFRYQEALDYIETHNLSGCSSSFVDKDEENDEELTKDDMPSGKAKKVKKNLDETELVLKKSAGLSYNNNSNNNTANGELMHVVPADDQHKMASNDTLVDATGNHPLLFDDELLVVNEAIAEDVDDDSESTLTKKSSGKNGTLNKLAKSSKKLLVKPEDIELTELNNASNSQLEYKGTKKHYSKKNNDKVIVVNVTDDKVVEPEFGPGWKNSFNGQESHKGKKLPEMIDIYNSTDSNVDVEIVDMHNDGDSDSLEDLLDSVEVPGSNNNDDDLDERLNNPKSGGKSDEQRAIEKEDAECTLTYVDRINDLARNHGVILDEDDSKELLRVQNNDEAAKRLYDKLLKDVPKKSFWDKFKPKNTQQIKQQRRIDSLHQRHPDVKYSDDERKKIYAEQDLNKRYDLIYDGISRHELDCLEDQMLIVNIPSIKDFLSSFPNEQEACDLLGQLNGLDDSEVENLDMDLLRKCDNFHNKKDDEIDQAINSSDLSDEDKKSIKQLRNQGKYREIFNRIDKDKLIPRKRVKRNKKRRLYDGFEPISGNASDDDIREKQRILKEFFNDCEAIKLQERLAKLGNGNQNDSYTVWNNDYNNFINEKKQDIEMSIAHNNMPEELRQEVGDLKDNEEYGVAIGVLEKNNFYVRRRPLPNQNPRVYEQQPRAYGQPFGVIDYNNYEENYENASSHVASSDVSGNAASSDDTFIQQKVAIKIAADDAQKAAAKAVSVSQDPVVVIDQDAIEAHVNAHIAADELSHELGIEHAEGADEPVGKSLINDKTVRSWLMQPGVQKASGVVAMGGAGLVGGYKLLKKLGKVPACDKAIKTLQNSVRAFERGELKQTISMIRGLSLVSEKTKQMLIQHVYNHDVEQFKLSLRKTVVPEVRIAARMHERRMRQQPLYKRFFAGRA